MCIHTPPYFFFHFYFILDGLLFIPPAALARRSQLVRFVNGPGTAAVFCGGDGSFWEGTVAARAAGVSLPCSADAI